MKEEKNNSKFDFWGLLRNFEFYIALIILLLLILSECN